MILFKQYKMDYWKQYTFNYFLTILMVLVTFFRILVALIRLQISDIKTIAHTLSSPLWYHYVFFVFQKSNHLFAWFFNALWRSRRFFSDGTSYEVRRFPRLSTRSSNLPNDETGSETEIHCFMSSRLC